MADLGAENQIQARASQTAFGELRPEGKESGRSWWRRWNQRLVPKRGLEQEGWSCGPPRRQEESLACPGVL